MKLSKKQQHIILGVLVAVAVLYVAYLVYGLTVSSRPKAKTPKSAKSAAGLSQTTDSGTPGQASNGSEQPETGIPPVALAPLARRDPFLVPRQPKPAVTPPAKKQSIPIKRNTTVNPFNPYGTSALPSLGGPPNLRMGRSVARAAEPNVVLSGIVRGAQNMAVLRVDGKPYMVRQGDTFAGNYKLVTVLRESVMVERNGITKRVSLGGKSNDN